MLEIKDIISITIHNPVRCKPKVLFIGNPSIQDCVEIVKTKEYIFVVPIYTGSVYDVPDWSGVSERYDLDILYGVVQPFYCKDDIELMQYVERLISKEFVDCEYFYKDLKLVGEIK